MESSLNIAETSTSPFVFVVTSAEATGASGATLSMFVTSNVVTSDSLPAASIALKKTVVFSLIVTPSTYSVHSPFSPSL